MSAYRHLVNDKNEIHIRLTPEGKVAFINHDIVRELDLKREEILDRDLHELLPSENHAEIDRQIRSLTPDNPSTTFELHIHFPFGEGDYIWTVQAIYSRQNGDPELIEYQVTGRNAGKRFTNDSPDQSHLRNISVQTIRSLAKTIEVKDPYTYGHQMRVAYLAVSLAREMGPKR